MNKHFDVALTVEFHYDPEKVDPLYYYEDGKKLWRTAGIYDIFDEDATWKHLVYNAIVNGVVDASSLDGWGDLERGELTMRVVIDDMDVH